MVSPSKSCWLLTFSTLVVSLGSPVPASGQSSAVGAFPGHAPILVNNVAIGDPYATTTTAPGTSWGDWIALPTVESFRDRFWIRLEWLYWGTEGMDLPPLVTTSPQGTPQSQAGVLGQEGTSVLFGGGEINGGAVSGFRYRSGFWMRQGAFGLETEWFRLGNQRDGFSAASDGSTILARPFFDVANTRETALLLAHPNIDDSDSPLSGSIGIGSKTDLRSFLLAGRTSLVPVSGICLDPSNPADRVDWLIGYRQLELRDRLSLSDNRSLEGDSAAVVDSFRTKNRFRGLQLGFIYQANFQRVWLESLLRVAIGRNRQSVDIFGDSSITSSGVTTGRDGGLLAQRTNSGLFRRSEFSMIPEVGLNLGIRVSRCLHATIGYSILYFPSVVRAGEQIDTDINPDLFSDMPPPEAAVHPRFRYIESDYWAQGLNLGAELAF